MKYGLPRNLTLYGGLQGSQNYHAAALGIGAMLGDFGAISTDVTQADSQKNKQKAANVGAFDIISTCRVEHR